MLDRNPYNVRTTNFRKWEVSMKKVYVLDTNVILADPLSLFSFEDNVVVIPSVVLQEVDKHKRRMDEVGRNSREFNRVMDTLRQQGNLNVGITLEGGGLLKVLYPPTTSSVYQIFNEEDNDICIIALAKHLTETGNSKVVVVSKDVSVRVRCDAVYVEAEDYLNDRVVDPDDSFYKGYRIEEVTKEEIDSIYQCGFKESGNEYPNEFVVFKHGQSSVITRNVNGRLLIAGRNDKPVWGITPRNVEQRMALDLLLDRDVPVVTLTGKAGTGKTLLALASSLKMVEDDKIYKNLLITRPIIPMGRDIGYLPGEKEEKLRPWMQPIYDNLEFLCSKGENPKELVTDMMNGLTNIQIDALTYIRGRSIPEQMIIIDEAQNLTKHEVKTILTRVGEGSKIVLVGDPEQIDHPYLDAYSNGLTYVIEKLKDQEIAGHVNLTKGVRSKVAQVCANIL